MIADDLAIDDPFLPGCWCEAVDPRAPRPREVPEGFRVGNCLYCGRYALLPIDGDTRMPVAFVVAIAIAAAILAALVMACRGIA